MRAFPGGGVFWGCEQRRNPRLGFPASGGIRVSEVPFSAEKTWSPAARGEHAMQRHTPPFVRAALLCSLAMLGLAQSIGYHLEISQPLSRYSARQLALLSKLNHADSGHLGRLARIIVPTRWDLDELLYSPMPSSIESFSGEKKAILVDLAGQTFGAYEAGALVRWGPVSSGNRSHQTPAGVYHLNWHSPLRVSSENSSWIMPWYFNFSSGLGLALHQFTLPGRPASHGCVRLLSVDARWLYQWGEGWLMDETRALIRPGTLVLLVGKYSFASPQPWLKPQWWSVGAAVHLATVAYSSNVK